MRALLKGALHDIAQAATIMNGGAPAPQDIAELMHAWDGIVQVVANPQAARAEAKHDAAMAMMESLTGEKL